MNTVNTRVGNRGQEIYAFEFDTDQEITTDNVSLEDNYLDTSIEAFIREKTRRTSNGILDVIQKNGRIRIEVEPFAFQAPYKLTVGETRYTAEDFPDVRTDWADRFEPHDENGVLYRLYRPSAEGPRPLILFLHGGGEKGYDNWKQLTGCFGGAYLAETYPDYYVMAPQAKGREATAADIEAFKKLTFATSDQDTETGWNRTYLNQICDIIRRMIRKGEVNPQRVYVTGLSMGGGGTIRAMSVGSDLFAAGVPVCPSMTPETVAMLKGLTRSKIWIAAAYIDHTLYRHKYIVDCVLALKDAGNRNVYLTLYSPEELAEYGIGVIPGMDLEALFGWNHTCWIPTYHNAHGIMSWMTEQTLSSSVSGIRSV